MVPCSPGKWRSTHRGSGLTHIPYKDFCELQPSAGPTPQIESQLWVTPACRPPHPPHAACAALPECVEEPTCGSLHCPQANLTLRPLRQSIVCVLLTMPAGWHSLPAELQQQVLLSVPLEGEGQNKPPQKIFRYAESRRCAATAAAATAQVPGAAAALAPFKRCSHPARACFVPPFHYNTGAATWRWCARLSARLCVPRSGSWRSAMTVTLGSQTAGSRGASGRTRGGHPR